MVPRKGRVRGARSARRPSRGRRGLLAVSAWGFALRILALALLALPLSGQALRFTGSQKTGGVLDLQGIPRNGYAELNCLWDFWPNRFVDPSEADKGGSPYAVPVPSLWDRLGIEQLRSTGYATYHLRVTGLPPDMVLGLKLTNTLSAARVFVNGAKELSIGRAATEAGAETPRWDSQIAILERPHGADIDLTIQVSNYVDFSGGISRPILLGDYRALSTIRTTLVTPEMFEVGALGIIGFYCILLFAFRPKDLSTLYFGLLALVLAVRVPFYDEFLIYSIFPNLPFEALFRIGYLTFSLPFLLFAGFFRHSFRRHFPLWLFATVAVFTTLYSLFIALMPMHVVAMSLFATESVMIALGLAIIASLFRAFVARHERAALIAAGFLMFFIPAVHDILVNNGYLHDPYFAPFGTILFFLLLAVQLTGSSTRTLKSRTLITIEREKPRLLLSDRGLSATEIDYALALLSGRSVKEIAFDREVSESTVRNSLSRVYAKLEVPSMAGFLSLSSVYDIAP